MTPHDIQWPVVTYTIDAGLSDVVTNQLSEIEFTISPYSRNDKRLDLICYGRDAAFLKRFVISWSPKLFLNQSSLKMT